MLRKPRLTAPIHFRWAQARHTVMLLGLAWATALLLPVPTHAGKMVNDPQGFYGIPWGASLANVPEIILTDSSEHIKEYKFKDSPKRLGDAEVERVRFSAIDGKFARVYIRYGGEKTHELVLAYLESRFGPVKRMPGMMVRGLNQQYNWRGTETEINMTYQGYGERGYIYVESRTLAARFLDVLPEGSF
ncbi:MAG: hypothetical protein ACE5MM_00660 [Nitrospiraceae bacterium]